jgi:hypothetical protein
LKIGCCNCGKKFQSNSGLWKHQKIHKIQEEDKEKEDEEDEGINIKDQYALVLHLLKQNSNLQNKIIEMSSQIGVTNNIHSTNSHNSHNNNAF